VIPVILNADYADPPPNQTAIDRANELYAEAEKQGTLPSRVVADSGEDGGVVFYWFRGERSWSAIFVGNDGEVSLQKRTPPEKLFVNGRVEGWGVSFEFAKANLAAWARGASVRFIIKDASEDVKK
jgi:hypothetical protein